MKISPKLLTLARILIGFIFAYAGFTKLIDPIENFQGNLAQYEVIPYVLTPFIARVLPWVEFLSGAMFILGYAPKWNAAILGGMCLVFLLVLGSSESFLGPGPHDCGCFGENSPIKLTVHQVFVMDLINLLLCLKIAFLKDHPLSLDRILRA